MSRENNSDSSATLADFALGYNFTAANSLPTSTSFPIVDNPEDNSVTDRAANQRIPVTHAESSNAGVSNAAPPANRVYTVSPQQVHLLES